ncbi:MAG TPA: PBP1A family penicillin-binding protein [Acidimicrobiales bacterium]|nr:PBP1A family penicillin-binding protein [Acidimicrobiales bacterium]
MPRWSAAIALAAIVVSGCSYTPPRAALAPPTLNQSTQIFDAQGRLITRLEAEENRENVRLSELPEHLLDAVIAIEDDRFWEHKGVDVKAILRAAVTNTQEGEVAQGGSTITQQYVKNALLGDEKTINRKVKEAILAVQLERASTKERILELYLNTIYFGNGAYGVQAASEEYFGTPASEISLAQAALLAGLIQSPSRTDPYDDPEAARERRDIVLERMAQLGYIDDEAADFASHGELLVRTRPEHERYPAAHFVEQVKRFVLDDPRFGATPAERRQLLFGGGLRITTTLDLDRQAEAEMAVASVRPPAPGPDAALVSMEAKTGYVRALVGGRDFFSGGERAKLDLVTGGPGRPAGSSFKPLVLAAALENGITLDRVYKAPSRLTIPLPTGDWEVENYEGTAGGSATLFEATVRSYNTVYAQLIMDVGPEVAMDTARRLGVRAPLFPYPSSVLGTNDVHPIDMATAYATLANRGIRVDPVFVTEISTVDGRVLYEHQHRQERAISEQVADEVAAVLQQAVQRGTGTRARLADRAVAGKTGTGQEWRDAWFVGFTPDVVTSVWMGFADEGRRSMKPPATPLRVSGGTWPATIWRSYMEPALAGTPVATFPDVELTRRPSGEIELDDLLLPRVPDVSGMAIGAARAALEARGYLVQERPVENLVVAPSTVVAQRPRGGSRLALGEVVVLDVAGGAALVEVVSTLGLTEAEARAALEGAGFVVQVLYQVGGDAGRVWAQSPPDGAAVAGSTVQIWVGPPVETTTTSTTTTTTTVEATTTTVVQD